MLTHFKDLKEVSSCILVHLGKKGSFIIITLAFSEKCVLLGVFSWESVNCKLLAFVV